MKKEKENILCVIREGTSVFLIQKCNVTWIILLEIQICFAQIGTQS
jgi:hypothetical protein